jgi:peptide/nickel transport system substrate-binding protein
VKKFLGFLLILGLLLSACQSATPTTPPVGPTSLPAGPTSPPVGPTSAPATEAVTQAPATSQSILRLSGADLIVIDPSRALDYNSSTATNHLYDSLVFPNKDAGTDPWLAESWDVSSDNLTYTFHLRQDVKFHDGSELDASDVIYSWKRFSTIGQGYFYLIPKVDSVTAIDDHTVEFKLVRATGLFVPSLIRLWILNEDLVRQNYKADGTYGAEGDYGMEWLTTHDAGSGPYAVKEFPLEQYLLMEKNTNWWGEMRPDAPDLFKILTTSEAITVRNLFADKQLEISDMWQSIENLQALDALDGVDIKVSPSVLGFYYMINNAKPPFDDIHCRKAAAYGMEYEKLLTLEWPGTQLMVGPVPRSLGGWDPKVFSYTYDPAKAKEELAQCKYANELANHPIVVNWPDAAAFEEKFALLFQADMAALGMTVNIQALPLLNMEENVSTPETSPNIASFYVSADLSEAGLMLQQRYSSATAGTWQQVEWLRDPTLDAAIQDALDTVDVTQRYAKYAELQNRIMELSPSLFMYEFPYKQAFQTYVDWNPEGNSQLSGYNLWAPRIGVKNP